MKVKEKKPGKFKIVGLTTSDLIIIKETLEWINEDLVCRELTSIAPDKILKTLDSLHGLIFESLGDYY